MCNRCKKKKTEGYFNDIDFGWGNFKKSNWCKVCDTWMDKERNKANNKQRRFWAKERKEFVKNGGVIPRPVIGRSMMIDFTKNPKGEDIELCKGWYADDEGWRKRGILDKYIENENN